MSSRNRFEHYAHDQRRKPGNAHAREQRCEERPAVGGHRPRTKQLVVCGGGEDGDCVGSNAKEAYMAHGQQPRVAHHQVQADRQYGPDGEHRCQGDCKSHALPYCEHDCPR